MRRPGHLANISCLLLNLNWGTFIANFDSHALGQIGLLTEVSQNLLPVKCYLTKNRRIRLKSNRGTSLIGLANPPHWSLWFANFIFLNKNIRLATDFSAHPSRKCIDN